MQLYGIKAGDSVILTGPESGKKIILYEEIEAPNGYEAYGVWEEYPDSLKYMWRLRPIEGTTEEAALKLSKLQAKSLPDVYALEVSALFDEWIAGQTYYGPDQKTAYAGDRIRYKGVLYKVLQGHVSQADWTPDAAPSLYAKVLPGQEGNEPESGYAEWVQPESTNGYSTGDKVVWNGHLWESIVDSNVDEPGTDNGFRWKDLGEYQKAE